MRDNSTFAPEIDGGAEAESLVELTILQATTWTAVSILLATLGVLSNAATLTLARKFGLGDLWFTSLVGCLAVGPAKLAAVWTCRAAGEGGKGGEEREEWGRRGSDAAEVLASCLLVYLEVASSTSLALTGAVGFCRRLPESTRGRMRKKRTMITMMATVDRGRIVLSHLFGFVVLCLAFAALHFSPSPPFFSSSSSSPLPGRVLCLHPRRRTTVCHRSAAVFCLLATATAACLVSRGWRSGEKRAGRRREGGGRGEGRRRGGGGKEERPLQDSISDAATINAYDGSRLEMETAALPARQSASSGRRKSRSGSRAGEDDDDDDRPRVAVSMAGRKSGRRHTVANIGSPFQRQQQQQQPSGKTRPEATPGDGGVVRKADDYRYVRKWSVDVSALADQLENPRRHAGSFPVLSGGRPSEPTPARQPKAAAGRVDPWRSASGLDAAPEAPRLRDDRPEELGGTAEEEEEEEEEEDGGGGRGGEETEASQAEGEESNPRAPGSALLTAASVALLFKVVYACATFSVDLLRCCSVVLPLEAAVTLEWTVLPLALAAGSAGGCRRLRSLKFVCYCNVVDGGGGGGGGGVGRGGATRCCRAPED